MGKKKKFKLPEVKSPPPERTESASSGRGDFFSVANLVVMVLLLVCTLAVYWQVIDHDFLNFDDGQYVTQNAQVQAGLTLHGLQWAFSSSFTTNWHPLTWLSHMLDAELYGLNPAGHHVSGLLIHLLNTLLLFLLLKKITGAHWRSAFVAMLFAIHPLHVESVAWVAERKDVLSTFFWMLTLWLYADYVRTEKRIKYGLAIFVFALGLMSKPMVVTLPFVLLLLDYWPLRRVTFDDGLTPEVKSKLIKLALEKLPFLFLAVISSVITVMVGDVQSIEEFTLWGRIGNALVSYVAYLSDMFWPHPLVIFRPHPGELPLWQPLSALVLLIAITGGVIRWGRQHPYLPVGWFLYLGVLLPVIGLIQVGIQARADRYTYVPLIGIAIMLAWGLAHLTRNWQGRKAPMMVAGVLATLVLMACTYQQVGYLKDSQTAFEHVVKYEPNAHYAHNNLALAYQSAGNLDKAIEHFNAALTIKPDKYESVVNLGVSYFRKGDLENAERQYRRALEMVPNSLETLNNLGNIYQARRQMDQAIEIYNRALTLNPNHPEVNNNMGSAYFSMGQMDQAMEYFIRALNAFPNYPDARTNLGRVLGFKGNHQEALKQFLLALEIRPNDPVAHDMAGVTYVFLGQRDKAIEHYRKALSINPNMQLTRERLQQLLDASQGAEP